MFTSKRVLEFLFLSLAFAIVASIGLSAQINGELFNFDFSMVSHEESYYIKMLYAFGCLFLPLLAVGEHK